MRRGVILLVVTVAAGTIGIFWRVLYNRVLLEENQAVVIVIPANYSGGIEISFFEKHPLFPGKPTTLFVIPATGKLSIEGPNVFRYWNTILVRDSTGQQITAVGSAENDPEKMHFRFGGDLLNRDGIWAVVGKWDQYLNVAAVEAPWRYRNLGSQP